MGWKNVKEHYRIVHIAQMVPARGLCIGSSLCHDLIVLNGDGVVVKRWDSRCNDDINRYLREFDADPAKAKSLLSSPDTFAKSTPVYTYDGDQILEKQCEELGWPNLTHDGEMMYDNTYSQDKIEVVKWAKDNAAAGVKIMVERVQSAKDELAKVEQTLAEYEGHVRNLDSQFGSPGGGP